MRNRALIRIEKSQLTGIEKLEGETIEQKIERIMENKEPITDGAPEIYTERKAGVQAAYNIRTDRWEVAAEAMDVGSKSIQARRDEKAAEMTVVKDGESDKSDKVVGD